MNKKNTKEILEKTYFNAGKDISEYDILVLEIFNFGVADIPSGEQNIFELDLNYLENIYMEN